MNTLKAGLIAATLVMTGAAMAQNGNRSKSVEERAQFRTERLAKELSLTEEQKTKVAALNVQQLQKKEAIMKDASLSEEQRKEAIRASHQSDKEQLNAILTPEQQAKLAEKRTEMKQEHAGKDGAHARKSATPEERAQFRTERLSKHVELTEDQKLKITASNLRTIKETEAIRNDAGLTEDQRKAAYKGSRKAYKADLNVILTPEQQKQLEAAKSEQQQKRGDRKCAKPSQH